MTEKIEVHNVIKSFGEIPLTINWKYLSRGHGVRKVEDILQVVLGRILFWSCFVVEFGILISEVTKGFLLKRIITVSSASGGIFWILAFISIYSLYLLRNRELFMDKARTKNLFELRSLINRKAYLTQIDVSDYINPQVLWLIDFIFNISLADYLESFCKKLLKLPKIKALIQRLGLTQDNLELSVLAHYESGNVKTSLLGSILIGGFLFAYENHLKYVNEEAIMYVFLKDFFSSSLQKFNITPKDLDGIKLWLRNEAIVRKYVEDYKGRVSIKPKTTVNRAYTSRFTPTLNEFARDFTHGVIQGDFMISLAREDELSKLVTILEKGDKSAVLVIGEPGVGKTTLIRSLAVRMVVEDVPKKLQDKRLVAFDFNKAFTSSQNIESFKKKLRKVFDEVARAGNVILVLDNVNQLLNLRHELAGEIANIIIDSYDSSNMRLIATTDRGQYIRYIRPNSALAGIFSPVEMGIPSDEVAIQIIIDEVPRIEGEYNVRISYSAIKAAVELSHKFAYDRVLPDKAIDLLKETVVNYKHLAGAKPIEYDEVAKVVSSKVGVKLGSIQEEESIKLSRLEKEMHKRVIGQDEAIIAVSAALRRARSGLNEGGRPIASFLFFGPTGVGKTEVAKTVAEAYYGSEDRMVRIDMSEYNEEENVKRLTGFMSEQGAFEGGFLTEPVHTYPFSLVLLDEIDKANGKVLDLFLQVLDEGYLNDGLGRRVDFSNTIIIMTSNAGSSVIAKLLEERRVYEEVRLQALEELKKVFRIEFLNRFDKVIMFKPLQKEEVKLVAKKFVEQIRLKLLDKGIKLIYNDDLLVRLASLGYSPVFGAREMRRIVQDEVENKIADMVVKGEARAGGEVRL